MKITKEEYRKELASLKFLGVTAEEIEGIIEFFNDTVITEEDMRDRKTRILNSRSCKGAKND